MRCEIEVSGPLKGNKLTELLQNDYILSLHYSDVDEFKIDLDEGLFDELLKDPFLKTLNIDIYNKNFINPFDPRNFFKEKWEIPRVRRRRFS